MAFLQMLQEMLTRDDIADLARPVAIMSIEKDNAGELKKYLNINMAEKGKVEWIAPVRFNLGPSMFIVKGKFLKQVYPKVKGKIGKSKFVDRDEIMNDNDFDDVGAIQSDSSSIGLDRSIRGGMGGAE